MPRPRTFQLYHHTETRDVEGLTLAQAVELAQREKVPPEATISVDCAMETACIQWPVSVTRPVADDVQRCPGVAGPPVSTATIPERQETP